VTVAGLCRKALRFPADAGPQIVPLSAQAVRERAPKAVTKPETMNYQMMLPEPGGLFDPKLFGAGTVIDAPLPDPDAPHKPRKTQLARITLAVPIVHPLLAHHASEEVAALIGRSSLAREPGGSQLDHGRALVDALGATEGARDLVISELPVLPPDLRSLARDDEDRWATTPINRWYQRILYANARLAKHIDSGAEAVVSLANEYAEIVMLVQRLFENDELSDPERDPEGKPLPSLRTLCGGTSGLVAAVGELKAPIDGESIPGRQYVARTVMRAMGFEVLA
jgi:DNA-directed RNA polymerase beta' subunit